MGLRSQKHRGLMNPVPIVAVLAATCFLTFAVHAQQTALPPEVIAYADIIVYNGKIITATDDFRIVEALAVRDGDFLAVGTSDRIKRMAGPNTRQIDLGGKGVVPGFINTHSHGWVGNISKLGIDGVVACETIKSCVAEVKAIVDKTTPGEWLWISASTGGGGSFASYTLTAQDLDPVSPKNPIAMALDNDNYRLNSVGLKVAGLTPEMTGVDLNPDTGQPNGRVRSFAFGKLVYEIMEWPVIDEAVIQREIERQKRGPRQGITMRAGRAQGVALAILNEVWKRGEMQVRARIAWEVLRNNGQAEAYLKRMGNLSGFGDEWMKINSLSFQHPDGGTDARMLTSRPKLRMQPGDPHGPYGQNRWLGLDALTETDARNIVLALKYGWDITSIHSMGDQSHRVLLNAFKEGLNQPNRLYPWKTPRLSLDHNTIHEPDTIQLTKELGVMPSVTQHEIFTPNQQKRMLYNYGADRVSAMGPVKSFLDAGIRASIEWGSGNTAPGYSSALWILEKSVTRKDDSGRLFGPDQRLSRKQALWMVTNWSAYYTQEQDVVGTIEEGKWADFVILSGDYLTVPEDEISELEVLMTVIDGQIMFERKPGDPLPETRGGGGWSSGM